MIKKDYAPRESRFVIDLDRLEAVGWTVVMFIIVTLGLGVIGAQVYLHYWGN